MSNLAQKLINKFDEHGSFIDLHGIAEAFQQDKDKSLMLLSEFLDEQDQNTKPLIDEIAKLKQDLKAAESVNEQYRIGLIEIKHSLTESRQKIIEAITNPI